jgi:hypothetical protein
MALKKSSAAAAKNTSAASKTAKVDTPVILLTEEQLNAAVYKAVLAANGNKTSEESVIKSGARGEPWSYPHSARVASLSVSDLSSEPPKIEPYTVGELLDEAHRQLDILRESHNRLRVKIDPVLLHVGPAGSIGENESNTSSQSNVAASLKALIARISEASYEINGLTAQAQL